MISLQGAFDKITDKAMGTTDHEFILYLFIEAHLRPELTQKLGALGFTDIRYIDKPNESYVDVKRNPYSSGNRISQAQALFPRLEQLIQKAGGQTRRSIVLDIYVHTHLRPTVNEFLYRRGWYRVEYTDCQYQGSSINLTR